MNTIYINGLSCISPQPTFDTSFVTGNVIASDSVYLQCMEPAYKEFLSSTAIRRMGRLQKMSIVTALSCLQDAGIEIPDAIITGTGLGCLADSEQFLTSILENTEYSLLSPTAFIQSTHNTIGSQIAIQVKCKGANYTYTQRHFSFESGLLDSILLLKENSAQHLLLLAADEMPPRIYEIINRLGIWPAPIGEGVCSFLLSTIRNEHSYVAIPLLKLHYGKMNAAETIDWIQSCLSEEGIALDSIDTVIQDDHSIPFTAIVPEATWVSYKEYTGEYFTASAFAYWLGAHILKRGQIPVHCIRRPGKRQPKQVLIYNQMGGKYHSLATLTIPD